MAKTKHTEKIINAMEQPAVATTQGKETIVGIFVWTVVAIIGLSIAYSANKTFFDSRINAYWDEYQNQKEELDIDERKKTRYGWPYYIADMLTKELKKKNAKTTDVLLVAPSLSFFGGDKTKQAQYGGVVPEPSVFYYYSGTKIVQKNCKNNCEAKWYTNITPNGFSIEPITSKQQQDSVISSWSAYEADKY